MVFWQQPCIYCGKQITTAGIDRIDNNVGYTIDNCVACCRVCNWMKMQMDVDEWFDHMFTILKKNNIV
jgi:deoxycytidylate deaminase